jgi:hypothetical protein
LYVQQFEDITKMGEIFDELFIFFLIKKTTNQFLVSFNKNQKKKNQKNAVIKKGKKYTPFFVVL